MSAAPAGRGAEALALLLALEAAGVRVEVGQGGDTLKLSGVRPPAELLAQVKDSKAAILEALTRGAADLPPNGSPGTVAPRPSPDLGAASPGEGQNAPPLPLPARPDWAAISSSPGHCGSCARFELAPDWGDMMGVCLAPAWAWLPDRAPLAIHTGHRCAAQGGQGYRAKGGGKRYTVSATGRASASPLDAPQPQAQPHGQGRA